MTKKLASKKSASKEAREPYPNGLAALAKPGAALDDLRACRTELAAAVKVMIDAAILHIAEDNSRAEGARRFLRDVEALAQRFHAQHVSPTRLEGVLGALGAMMFVVRVGGVGESVPNHAALAQEILWNRRGERDFEQQVKRLAAQLCEHFDGWNRLPSDRTFAAEEAFRIAGVNPYNVIDAPARMRASRARGPALSGPRRRPRT